MSSETLKLQKVLNLIPIIFSNPGISLNELKEISDFKSVKELKTYLKLAIMFGVPPFSPMDFIDIYIDENDKLEIILPQGLDRPVNLTHKEWAAVVQALTEATDFQYAGLPGQKEIQSLLSKLSDIPIAISPADPVSHKKAQIEEAIKENLQVEFKYKTLHSKESEIRRTDPWLILLVNDFYYLAAYCHLRRQSRFFLLDRMEDLSILEIKQTSKIPKNFDKIMQSSYLLGDQQKGFTVEIAFDKGLLYTLSRNLNLFDVEPLSPTTPYKAQGLQKNRNKAQTNTTNTIETKLKAKCKISDSIWFKSFLRGFGPSVWILAPEHLRSSFVEELRQIPIPELYSD